MNVNGKMRMRPDESIPGMGGRIKESNGGVNSAMICCKSFCKCQDVPPPNTTIKKYIIKTF
jgi:hypothetical protein